MRMGENESAFFYYSSTEYSDAYVLCIDEAVDIIGYRKYNYIGSVRQVRKAKLDNVEKFKYQIGDLITNEDGSKGIVYYLSPDGLSGEMIALHDLPGVYSWSVVNDDIVDLENVGDDSYHGMCLDAIASLDGKQSTEIIRKAGTESEYPAAYSMQDMKDWYLPTAGQMNRIFAHSRIIDEVAINNGGDEISYENYWTSNELNFFQSWYFSMVYGYSDAEIKDEEFLVRPVRNFTVCEPEIEYIEIGRAHV